MEAIADYITSRTQDREKARHYVVKLRKFIEETLRNFPYAGRPTPEFGHETRKLVYKGYSIIYTLEAKRILILTIYRENLP